MIEGRSLNDEETIRHALKCLGLHGGEAAEIAGEAMEAFERISADEKPPLILMYNGLEYMRIEPRPSESEPARAIEVVARNATS